MTDQKKPNALIIDDSSTATATYGGLLAERFDVVVANSRAQAKRNLDGLDDLAVVLCDYQLEDGLGTDVLRDIARSHPAAKATLITAHGSLRVAQEAINCSLAHRFLEKGGPLSDVLAAMDDCLADHIDTARRLDTEAAVLDGAVTSMVEAVCVQEPRLRRLSSRLSDLASACEMDFTAPIARTIRIASLVAYIGLLKVPFQITRFVFDGTPIGADEWRAFRRYPEYTADMIRHYPKLKDTAALIETALAPANSDRPELAPCAELLRACNDATWLVERLGAEAAAAVLAKDSQTTAHRGRRDALRRVGAALRRPGMDVEEPEFVALRRPVSQLLPGDALIEDLLDGKGRLLLARGSKLTAKMIENLRAKPKLAPGIREVSVIRSMIPAMPTACRLA